VSGGSNFSRLKHSVVFATLLEYWMGCFMTFRTFVPLCFSILLLSAACDRTDRERAREKAQEAGRKAEELSKKAGEEAKKVGQDVKSSVDSSVNSAAAQDAGAKLKQGGHDLATAGNEATRKLDKAATITKIKARLAADAGLTAAANVKVDVDGQVATLTGTVDSEAQKSQAAVAAAKVPGIIKVVDHLQVK
jgi:hyperosmotically inducible periplasmic protein